MIRRVLSATVRGLPLPGLALPGLLASAVTAVVLGVGVGCGEVEELDDGLPLVTIADCEDMGGIPLFDPEDDRPIESSCPDGLDAIAEFDEDFYGGQGGVCCTSDDGAGDPAAAIDEGATNER